MKTKKEILKKYIGKGGPVRAVPISGRTPGEQGFEITKTPNAPTPFDLVGMSVKGIGSGIKKGIQWAGNQVVGEIKGGEKKGKDLEVKNQQEKSGEYVPEKKQVLKDTIKKTMPLYGSKTMPLDVPKTMPANIVQKKSPNKLPKMPTVDMTPIGRGK